jgi:radical SAM superfamily enzyme YgiQ (UPF0313 family)
MHNQCKFCSLYYGTRFRKSPITEITEDLLELKQMAPCAKRVFLTGANPLGLSHDALITIAEKIKIFLPKVFSIGGFARIADIQRKTQKELKELHALGYDAISIGTETGDDATLAYMNKGNNAADIIEQLHKLDAAGITYNIVFMNGLAGAGNGERHALESARIYNQVNPVSINIVALTIFPESELHKEVLAGTYTPAGEVEKLFELKTFLENLTITTRINANTVSNTAPFVADIPKDKQAVIEGLQQTINGIDETQLTAYRNSIRSL